MLVVSVIVPDAIAGERERHTLATLLASRLPDRAILYGKLGFAVGLGWLSAPLVLAIALLVVNVASADAAPLFYDPGTLVGVLVFSLLVALLTGGTGILVSLRARTSQEAQQMTVVGLMTPFMLAGFGMTFLFSNDELARPLVDWLGSIEARYVALGVMAVVGLVDALILRAADRRFRRGRLAER
jgi:ABC-2 type transport system permease protein